MLGSEIYSKALIVSLLLAFMMFSIGFFTDAWLVAKGNIGIITLGGNIGIFRECFLGQCRSTGDYPMKALILACVFVGFILGLASLALSVFHEFQKSVRPRLVLILIQVCVSVITTLAITGGVFFDVYAPVVPGGFTFGWSQIVSIVSLLLYAVASGLNAMVFRALYI